MLEKRMWEDKRMYGQFVREMSETTDEKKNNNKEIAEKDRSDD